MDLIADVLLVAGALGAGLYCFVLARRLGRFNDLETGVGGAVAVLSAQVDDLSKTLVSAQTATTASAASLEELINRADTMVQRLELHLASLHDVPQQPEAKAPEPPEPIEAERIEKDVAQPFSTRRIAEPVFMRRAGGES